MLLHAGMLLNADLHVGDIHPAASGPNDAYYRHADFRLRKDKDIVRLAIPAYI